MNNNSLSAKISLTNILKLLLPSILIFTVVVHFFGLIDIFSPIKRIKCIMNEGNWKSGYCTYPDQGNPCKSSDECKGFCVVTDFNQKDVVGFCNTYSRAAKGCSAPIENLSKKICVD